MPIRVVLQGFLYLCPWLKDLRPEWFLPSTVILKKEMPKENDEQGIQSYKDMFENERGVYEVLKPLQGTVIPCYYGLASYDGCRAHVLSDVCGKRLWEIYTTRPENDDHILEDRIQEAFKALYKYRIEHGDAELHNIFEVGERIMLVDFEFAGADDRATWERSHCRAEADYVMYQFRLEREQARASAAFLRRG